MSNAEDDVDQWGGEGAVGGGCLWRDKEELESTRE